MPSGGTAPSAFAGFVSAGGLEVTAISGAAEMGGLRETWNRLLAASPSDSIFLSPDWLCSWWEAYGAKKSLEVLLFRRGGLLVGIAPLYRTSSPGAFPVRILRLVGDGSGDSDYLDLITARGEEEPVAASLLEYLHRNGRPWDVLALSEVPSNSPILAAMKMVAAQRGLFTMENQVSCTYVELPVGWDTYLAGLKPRMRTKVRSLLKKLAGDSRLSFHVLEDPAASGRWLEDLYRFHEARWRLEGQSGVFGLPGKRDFYARLTPRLLASGLLRFYGLFRDATPIALQYCFVWRDRVLLLQEGFDPTYIEEGVGNMLRARVLQDCIEKKVSAYDFLAGVTAHKLLWGGAITHTSRILIGNRSLRAAAHIYRPVVQQRLKEAIKRVVPAFVLAKLRRSHEQEASSG